MFCKVHMEFNEPGDTLVPPDTTDSTSRLVELTCGSSQNDAYSTGIRCCNNGRRGGGVGLTLSSEVGVELMVSRAGGQIHVSHVGWFTSRDWFH